MDDGYDSSQESGTPLPTKHANYDVGDVCGVRSITLHMSAAQCGDHNPQKTAHSQKPSQPVKRFRKSIKARGLPTETLADLLRKISWTAYSVCLGRKLGYSECCIQSFAAGRMWFTINVFDQMALEEKFGNTLGMVPCDKCITKLLSDEIEPKDLRSGRTRNINGAELQKLCEEAKQEADSWLLLTSVE